MRIRLLSTLLLSCLLGGCSKQSAPKYDPPIFPERLPTRQLAAPGTPGGIPLPPDAPPPPKDFKMPPVPTAPPKFREGARQPPPPPIPPPPGGMPPLPW